MQRSAAWDDDDYYDPVAELRYERELTTRDVATDFGVTQATVRQWVARGYIAPVGKDGVSNLFDTDEVCAAIRLVQSRRRASGHARATSGFFASSIAANRIPPKHYDAILTIGEAARLVEVSPSTIRSWIHRGHLAPTQGSKPGAVRLRLEDVISAARGRRLPQRDPAWRRRRIR